jgi:hypothetical protein
MRHVERSDTLIDTAWWKRGIIYQIYPRSFQEAMATVSATSMAYADGWII